MPKPKREVNPLLPSSSVRQEWKCTACNKRGSFMMCHDHPASKVGVFAYICHKKVSRRCQALKVRRDKQGVWVLR